LGCGHVTPDGWINVDGSPSARLARHPVLRSVAARLRLIPPYAADAKWDRRIFVHDLTRPLPFDSGSFSAVYSSHTLEHLHLAETRALLREVVRVLAPGGIARMVVPDLRAWVDDYLGTRTVEWPPEEFMPQTSADRLIRNLMMRTWNRPPTSRLRSLLGVKSDLHSHKWMFDGESLAWHMRDAGLVDVKECGYLESQVPGIAEVEKPGRIEGGQGVAVEGVKSHAQT
jgi:predicted SAM-dependent methyltransferase